MISKFKEKFSDLSPDKKRFVSVSISLIIFIIIAMSLYILRDGSSRQEKQAEVKAEQLDFGSNAQKDERTKMKIMFSKELSELNKKIEELKRQKEQMADKQSASASTGAGDSKKQPNQKDANSGSFSNVLKNYNYPPPPPSTNKQEKSKSVSTPRKSPFETTNNGRTGRTVNNENNQGGNISSQSTKQTVEEETRFPGATTNTTGDKKSLGTTTYQTISGISSMQLQQKTKSDKQDKKEKSDYLHNYIPSNSIYKATLITGVYAPTMSKGQSNPYPVLMRLNDLSFLPNEAKRNLEGCYISGEAWGSLSSERVEIRLLKMSCLDTNKNKVIDTSLKGYVIGEDSTIGLSGNVVSKQGKTLALAFVSNFLSGVGEAFGMSSQTTTFTTSGAQQSTINPSEILKYSAGSGFGESFKMLAEYYTNILNETSPVIEVKAGRDVGIIISEGKSIEMNKYKWDNFNKAKVKENNNDVQGVIYEYE